MKTLEDKWGNSNLYIMTFAAGVLFGGASVGWFSNHWFNVAAMICALIVAGLTMRIAYIEEFRKRKVNV